ncbi:MAG TPA: DUF1015 domain-containing protein [Nitrospirota bacterium]|nr:DUF1015 domain-containing protein [Nitrospirota bacterium]
MADIIPFKGIRYNLEKIKDPNLVMTPPYDIISPAQQEMYYNRDEYNMIKIDLVKEFPTDTEQDNRYTRASNTFSQWLSSRVMVGEERPSIYFYEVSYTKYGPEKTMKGFIALCRLEEFGKGKVVPHEYTLSKPKSDRLNLLRSCQANFSLIFSLYSSPDGNINKTIEEGLKSSAPDTDVVDDNGDRHRLWVVSDPAIIETIQKEMKDKTVYIADGHHRYEASFNYRNEARQKSGEGAYDYIMMFFANMDEPGLTVLPTHRLIFGVTEDKMNSLYDNLGKYFRIKDFEFSNGNESGARKQLLDALKKAGPQDHFLGMYIKGENKYSLLELIGEDILLNIQSDKPLSWRRLDVSILQSLILEDILGFSEESISRQENLCYVKDVDDSIRKVRDEEYQAAFLLNATKIEEIKDVTETGERMPQKSTYFYPKCLTGLVINKF